MIPAECTEGTRVKHAKTGNVYVIVANPSDGETTYMRNGRPAAYVVAPGRKDDGLRAMYLETCEQIGRN